MRTPRLEVLALSTYFAFSGHPQLPPLQIQNTLSNPEGQLVEIYQDDYHQLDEVLPKSSRRAAFLDQEIDARWYITEEAKKPVYSLITASRANNDLLLFVADRYLDKIKERYAVDTLEVAAVRDYIKENIAEVEKVRIDLQYAADQPQGILKLYDRSTEKLLGRTFISSSLALATLHFCSVEALGKSTDFLAKDYAVAQDEEKLRFARK